MERITKSTLYRLSEDDVVEGVFLVRADSEDEFILRLRELEDLIAFYGDAWEEDEEGGLWKLIAVASSSYKTLEEIKLAVNKLEKHDWFLWKDSDLLMNGKEIFSCGKWLQ